ncbi:EscU/YscU/HrcU family type III secretion system export apparatus switch protein [Salaquimonas pukyongi]|uniref:EscU/YscU/HrcU family type III secretion system export apparatus switch protein n=1 Tax=Salaquimonas pukyongi TaxID=2712698 RepID=UPI00096B97B8|nr:flagellar type III secretion system protein FlhB [Salaquimonas pukyongi]
MAEEAADKSEDPTEKRLQDTLDKGNVPFSREFAAAASIGAILVAYSLFLPDFIYDLTLLLRSLLGNLHDWPLDTPSDAQNLMSLVARFLILAMAPIILPLIAAGVIASLVQNQPRLVLNRIVPKFSKISPAAGLGRLFGKHTVVELLRSLTKYGAALIVGLAVFGWWWQDVMSLYQRPVIAIPPSILDASLSVIGSILFFVMILGAADFFYERHRWFGEIRMSKQEVKDEHKQSEGDPAIKQKTRAVARSRARARMMSQVPDATVVIANPTHFAVALRYRNGEDRVPKVLAKGQDLIALKIREIAEQNGINVVEDKPLARTLYKAVRVDADLPVEFYVPVAQIIKTVMETEKARMGR